MNGLRSMILVALVAGAVGAGVTKILEPSTVDAQGKRTAPKHQVFDMGKPWEIGPGLGFKEANELETAAIGARRARAEEVNKILRTEDCEIVNMSERFVGVQWK